jgi:hypothetical protein
MVRFSAAGCTSCHHKEAAPDCLSCHHDIRQRSAASPLGDFPHAFHVDDLELECGACHDLTPGKPVRLDEEICAGCHE